MSNFIINLDELRGYIHRLIDTAESAIDVAGHNGDSNPRASGEKEALTKVLLKIKQLEKDK